MEYTNAREMKTEGSIVPQRVPIIKLSSARPMVVSKIATILNSEREAPEPRWQLTSLWVWPLVNSLVARQCSGEKYLVSAVFTDVVSTTREEEHSDAPSGILKGKVIANDYIANLLGRAHWQISANISLSIWRGASGATTNLSQHLVVHNSRLWEVPQPPWTTRWPMPSIGLSLGSMMSKTCLIAVLWSGWRATKLLLLSTKLLVTNKRTWYRYARVSFCVKPRGCQRQESWYLRDGWLALDNQYVHVPLLWSSADYCLPPTSNIFQLHDT